jgi:hypothetical protein
MLDTKERPEDSGHPRAEGHFKSGEEAVQAAAPMGEDDAPDHRADGIAVKRVTTSRRASAGGSSTSSSKSRQDGSASQRHQSSPASATC